MAIWIKRILLGLLALLAAILLIIGGIFVFDTLFGPKTADVANTTFTDAEGNELLGYLAEPEGPGPHPAVLLIHEWWGLNEGLTILADADGGRGLCCLCARRLSRPGHQPDTAGHLSAADLRRKSR